LNYFCDVTLITVFLLAMLLKDIVQFAMARGVIPWTVGFRLHLLVRVHLGK